MHYLLIVRAYKQTSWRWQYTACISCFAFLLRLAMQKSCRDFKPLYL